MQPDDAKEYSWKWVTASELLCKTPCELCAVIQTCKTTPCRTHIFNGEDNTGEMVVRLECLANRSVPAILHHHIYCRRGLYVELSDDTYGIFIQWLERPQGIGYP